MSDATHELLSGVFFILPIATAFVFMALAAYPAHLNRRASERSITIFSICFAVVWTLSVVGFFVVGITGQLFAQPGLYWMVGIILVVVSGWFVLSEPFVVGDDND